MPISSINQTYLAIDRLSPSLGVHLSALILRNKVALAGPFFGPWVTGTKISHPEAMSFADSFPHVSPESGMLHLWLHGLGSGSPRSASGPFTTVVSIFETEPGSELLAKSTTKAVTTTSDPISVSAHSPSYRKRASLSLGSLSLACHAAVAVSLPAVVESPSEHVAAH